MKRLLLGFLTIFCAHLDAAQDWKWVRIINKRDEVIAHFSREALGAQSQIQTTRQFRLSTQDINDLKNSRVPKQFSGCSIEYGSEFPPDDESSNYASEESLSGE